MVPRSVPKAMVTSMRDPLGDPDQESFFWGTTGPLPAMERRGNEKESPIRQAQAAAMKAKLGPPAAVTATAHKIARIFYAMVKNQVEYDETNWQTQDEQRQRRLEAQLKRQAHQLGYQLVPIQPTP